VTGDQWAEQDGNPMFGRTADSERTKPVTIPSIDPATATEADKLAWVKARAAAAPWDSAFASVIQDMQMTGIPLRPDLMPLGMGLMMVSGERGVRDFIDGLTLGSVDREAADRG
jgi:hypothetical protein